MWLVPSSCRSSEGLHFYLVIVNLSNWSYHVLAWIWVKVPPVNLSGTLSLRTSVLQLSSGRIVEWTKNSPHSWRPFPLSCWVLGVGRAMSHATAILVAIVKWRLFQGHPQYDSDRINCFPCDITCPDPPLTDHIPSGCVDLITLIYVLSAITPEKMELAIHNIKQVNTACTTDY